MNAAVFLDRDGVLIEDLDLLTIPEQIRILPGVPSALAQLRSVGYHLIVVSNQAIVARGLISEQGVRELNAFIEAKLRSEGGPTLDGWLFCPHHPNATLPTYRTDCECRKPRPGMIQQGAARFGVNLGDSFMIGDRITDIIAGHKAGCRTILAQSGKHLDPPIETSEPLDHSIVPDLICADLPEAVDWILKRK